MGVAQWLRRGLLGAVVGLVVLGQHPVVGVECDALFRATRRDKRNSLLLTRTRQVCTRTFERTGDPAAGVRAAAAAVDGEEFEEVARWAERLDSTSAAASGWAFNAMAYEKRDFWELAAQSFQRALGLYQAQNKAAPAAQAARGLARTRWKRDELTGALEAIEIARQEALASGNIAIRAQVAADIAGNLYSLGDHTAARSALDRAQSLVPDDRWDLRAQLASTEGRLRVDQGNLKLARQSFERALEWATDAKAPNATQNALLSLAEVAIIEERREVAERYLSAGNSVEGASPRLRTRAVMAYLRARLHGMFGRFDDGLAVLAQALKDDPPPTLRWRLEHQRGRLLISAGRPTAARAALRRAIDQVEGIRGTLEGANSKHWALATRRAPHETLFTLEANAGQQEDALAAAERARGRAFLDAWRTSAVPAALPDWTMEDVAARVEIEERWRELLDTGVEAARGPVRPVPEVLAALHSVDVLGFFEAEGAWWALAVHHGVPRLRQLSATSEEIEQWVDDWVAEPSSDVANRRLGDALLPPDMLPAEPGLLYLVTEGSLGRIPLGALWVGDARLLGTHATSYVPSLGALAVLLQAPVPSPGNRSVVLGDPRGDLGQARIELTRAAKRLGTEARLGRDADLNALRQASGADWLHAASHGGLDEVGAWLELADRRIYADEVLELGLRPRRALLASCDTAARPGRGLWGSVAAGMLAAGTEVVVAPLWSIDDTSARKFVFSFYAAGGVEDPIGALAKVKRSFLAAGEPIETWWPFVAMGVRRNQEGRTP